MAPEECCDVEPNGLRKDDSLTFSPILKPSPVCLTRGQQGIDGWWRKTSSVKVLGHLRECMQSFAQHCLFSVQTPHTTTLQVLSLSDGSMNHDECVPTSVLLAHAFASLDIDALPDGLERIKIFGADVNNPLGRCLELMQMLDPHTRSWMPPWLELQHVRLDNNKNFKPQLFKCGLCPHSAKFDVVLMRQGLCYCQDQSFDCRPPEKLILTGIEGRDGSDEPSGIYVLEPTRCNRRPFYRNGNFLLHWRPPRKGKCYPDWAVVQDDETGNVWAYVCKDSGSPALAQAPWQVWDGKGFSSDPGVSCDVQGSCPWRRPPNACKCCAGISLNASAVQSFIGRVATVLDQRNPKAFALLHGGYYKGVADEVEEFHLELERAAEKFNSSRSCVCASVLRRQVSQDTEDDPTSYWNKIDGLLLSTSLA